MPACDRATVLAVTLQSGWAGQSRASQYTQMVGGACELAGPSQVLRLVSNVSSDVPLTLVLLLLQRLVTLAGSE